MKVMVINCGSSSLKFKLFDMDKNNVLIAEGMVDCIGKEKAKLIYKKQ